MRPYESLAPRIDEAVAIARGRIADACARTGLDAERVKIMAVTKFRPLTDALAAHEAGIRLFGENRVAEAAEKFASGLPADSFLHLIGTLQGNKVARAVAVFSCVQSVDSERLVVELSKRALAAGKRIGVMLELHAGEDTKAGFRDLDSLLRAAELVRLSASLELAGLMTMAPFVDDEKTIRGSFASLRRAAEAVETRFAPERGLELSMGMTNDFEIAVEEGSTLVRLGTALFGGRS